MTNGAPKEKGRLSGWRVGTLILLGLWGLWVVIYQFSMNQRDNKDKPCFSERYVSSQTSTEPIALTADAADALRLRFNQSRGTERDQVALVAGSLPPPELEVSVSALRQEGETIDGANVHVRARSQRNTVLLDLCVSAKDVGRVSSGVYRGTVTFTDQRVESFAVPVEVSIQARYLWWLAPAVILVPMLALLVVWGDNAGKPRTTGFGVNALRTLVPAIGAAGVVYGAQGIANVGWGGPQAVFGLIASMYAAATGAAVTVGSSAPGAGQQGGGASTPATSAGTSAATSAGTSPATSAGTSPVTPPAGPVGGTP